MNKMSDMLVKLYDLPDIGQLVEELHGKGIHVRPGMAREKHLIVNWVAETFGRLWASECDVAFSNRPISCFVASADRKIIGFSCFDCSFPNFFGPLGVDEEFRGQGIGRALLISSLKAMASAGYVYSIIGNTDSPSFYEKNAGAITIAGSSPGPYQEWLNG